MVKFNMARISKIVRMDYPQKIISFLLFFSFLLFGTARSTKAQSNTFNQHKPLFELIYFANLNGAIENCNCGDPPLGGLDRIATLIKQFRKNNSDLIVIDGGDTFNTYPFKELNKAVVQSYTILQPDIWILSEQELIEGGAFLANSAKNVAAKIISSNYKIKNIPSKRSANFALGEKKNVGIYSFLQIGIFNGKSEHSEIEAISFQHSLKNLKNQDFNILVFHGETEELTQKKQLFSSFDLILTAHQQTAYMDIGSKPAIIGAGTDGENIVHISLHKSGNRIIIKAERIPIGLEIESDPKINKFISDYKMLLKK